MIAAALAALTVAACPAETPAAMTLDGVPAVLVAGRSYEAGLVATGAGSATGAGGSSACSTGRGAGGRRTCPSLGFRQAFSVGLTGAPYAVSGAYLETLGDGTCTRTLAVSVPVERRVLGVVACRRGEVEPRTLTLGCDRGRRVRAARVDVARVERRRRDRPTGAGDCACGSRVRASVSTWMDSSTRARGSSGRSFVIDCPILD